MPATFSDYVSRIVLETDKAYRDLKKFDKEAGRTTGRVSKGFASLGNSIKGALGGIAVGAGVASLVKTAASIEAGFIGVKKTTGLADEEIRRLKKNLLDFSTKAPVAVESLIEIAKVAGQLGIQGSANIEKFTRTFAMLEIASDKTIAGEAGAQAFAKFLEQSGAGVERAEQIASAFTSLGNTSKLTEGQLLSMASELGKLSASFDVSAEAVLGIATAFQEMSIAPEVARSAFLRFFTAVDDAVKDGKGLKELSKITKLTRAELEELRKNEPEQILVKFTEGLQDAKKSGGNFNSELKTLKLRGLQIDPIWKALSVSGDRLAMKIDEANQASRENIALSNEFTAASEGLNSSIQRLENSWSKFADSLANSGLLEFLASTLDLMTKIISATPQLFKQTGYEIGQKAEGAQELLSKPLPFTKRAREEEANRRARSDLESAWRSKFGETSEVPSLPPISVEAMQRLPRQPATTTNATTSNVTLNNTNNITVQSTGNAAQDARKIGRAAESGVKSGIAPVIQAAH